MTPSVKARRTIAALSVALAAGLLAGCSSQSAPTTTRTVTATTATDSSNSPTAAASGSTSASTPSSTSSAAASTPAPAGRTDPNAPKGQCADSSLAVTVKYDPDGAGAGQRSAWVIFRNTGSGSCGLAGAPGVSLVGHENGTQLGQPADRTGDGSSTVTIPAGSYAGAQLNYTYVDKNGGNFNNGKGGDPGCKAAAANGYRIYPPHSFRAYFVRYPTYACTTDQRWIHVGPVQPASKVNVKP